MLHHTQSSQSLDKIYLLNHKKKKDIPFERAMGDVGALVERDWGRWIRTWLDQRSVVVAVTVGAFIVCITLFALVLGLFLILFFYKCVLPCLILAVRAFSAENASNFILALPKSVFLLYISIFTKHPTSHYLFYNMFY